MNLLMTLISGAANKVIALFDRLFVGFRPQGFVAIALTGLFLLTTSVDNSSLKPSTKAMLNDMIARGETGRPVTTAQWNAENERLQGEPAKQAKRIAKESADAVEEMAEIYPGNVKSVLPGMENNSLESDD
ncbi:MAG: hypothetical protein AAFR58_19260 [Cyanobacteria bacterium J06627_28]